MSDQFMAGTLSDLRDVTVELFRTYGVSGDLTTGMPRSAMDWAATVRFRGDAVEGAAVLAMSSSSIQALHPVHGASGVEPLRDWLGELANQLVGRLKQRLLRRAVTFELSTPEVGRGADVAVGEETVTLVLCDGDVEVALTVFEARAADGFAWGESHEQVADVGAVLLF